MRFESPWALLALIAIPVKPVPLIAIPVQRAVAVRVRVVE